MYTEAASFVIKYHSIFHGRRYFVASDKSSCLIANIKRTFKIFPINNFDHILTIFRNHNLYCGYNLFIIKLFHFCIKIYEFIVSQFCDTFDNVNWGFRHWNEIRQVTVTYRSENRASPHFDIEPRTYYPCHLTIY